MYSINSFLFRDLFRDHNNKQILNLKYLIYLSNSFSDYNIAY